MYGQFDMVKSSEHGSSNPLNHTFTDSNGEFEVFPLAIQDVVIDQAKADKFLIQALELVLLKMEMVLSDTIFGATQMLI